MNPPSRAADRRASTRTPGQPIRYPKAVADPDDRRAGSPTPRSPRYRLHRVHRPQEGRAGHRPADRAPGPRPGQTRRRRPSRANCSPSGATTPCSPTARSPMLAGRAAAPRTTRSSNRSSPTARTGALAHLPSGNFHANAAWLTLCGDRLQPAAGRRRPRLAPSTPRPPPPPSAPTWSTSPPASPAPPAASPCTCPTDWPWQHAWTAPVRHRPRPPIRPDTHRPPRPPGPDRSPRGRAGQTSGHPTPSSRSPRQNHRNDHPEISPVDSG